MQDIYTIKQYQKVWKYLKLFYWRNRHKNEVILTLFIRQRLRFTVAHTIPIPKQTKNILEIWF